MLKKLKSSKRMQMRGREEGNVREGKKEEKMGREWGGRETKRRKVQAENG